MKKKDKILLVLTILLLFLSISVVNASDNTNTNKTTQSLTKTTPQNLEKVATSTEEKQIQKEVKNLNTTQKEEKINKKTITQNTKTDPISVSDYTTLHNTLRSTSSDVVTINIASDITLDGSTTVHSAIKTLTINGNNYTINGNQQYQFLNITSVTTTNINNITITNCTAPSGGAIYNQGHLTITNSTLTHNNATWSGGAIMGVGNSAITINNSNLTHNTAYWGGAIHNIGGTLNINNSNLTHNNATYNGGAINNQYANMTLTQNNITLNTATHDGGAIYNYNYANMTLTQNNITHNNATHDGGAIHNYNYANMTLTQNNITHNTANNLGGAIYNYEKSYLITSTLFNNNTPSNFIINNKNHIELINTDNFIDITDFTIITDNGAYYGNGEEALEQYNIPSDALNVKLILNGTNTTDNTFILKRSDEKINIAKASISNEDPTFGSSTDIIATFVVEDKPVTEGKVIFRLNGKIIRDNYGNVICIDIDNGRAVLEDVQITNVWIGETQIQAIFTGNNELEPITSEVTTITVNKRQVNITITAPETAQRGDTITLKASITSEGLPLNTGRVAFKLNCKTLKDTAGKTLYVNVENGNAITNYTIPAKTKAKSYPLTAVFSDNTYERCQKETEITIT